MSLNIETAAEQPPSLIKYQPPIDITQKVDSFRKAITPQFPSEAKLSHQDILNIMLPPRSWRNSRHQQFMQYVSHSKPEREDVQLVQKKLDQSLLKMQARVEGICPIKQHLFSQVFDEIVRQVTLDCPERGLMLMRVRDQRKMTIAAYQTVYEEGISYGLKKQVESSEGMDQLNAQLKATQIKLAELQKKRKLLLSKKQSMQQKYRERSAVQSQKREYQRNALKSQNKHLESFLQKTRKPEPQLNQQPQQDEV